MAEEEQLEGEQKFREQYSEDPAGVTYDLYTLLLDLRQENAKLRSLVNEIDPEKARAIERTELLRQMNQKLDEML